jgi:ATP-dependent DNA ligase
MLAFWRWYVAKYKFQQLAPTPARGKFIPDLYQSTHWVAEEKYDGDRRIAQFVDGIVRFTGRRTSVETGLYVEKTDNVPHLSSAPSACIRLSSDPEETMLKIALDGCVLDGEVVCSWKGARSKDVTSIMGSSPEKAIAKQRERGWVEYRVFDCLFFKGIDVRQERFLERRSYMETVLREWDNPFATAAVQVDASVAEAYLHRIWKSGGEGIILKDIRSQYADEKSWVKVKREQTADVVIMGYAAAKKESIKVTGVTSQTKFAKKGWIGAVIFGQYKKGKLIECGQCSGMDDETREGFSLNKDDYKGAVMEISFQEREESGKFRHPRFLRLRPDKDPSECKWGVT